MTVQNASYNKAELRAIFLQCLEGLAFEHYKAHKETYQRMDYKELIQKYAERFGPKRRTGITEIVGITQSANEDVLAYRDRLLIAATPLLPDPVPTKKYLKKVDGTFSEIDNPEYEIETIKRQAALEHHDRYLVKFFLSGLKKEIVDRLQSMEYDTLSAAAEAAAQAEEYLLSVKQLHYTHNINVETPIAVNAVNSGKPLNDMERRGVPRGRSQTKPTDNDVCFRCGKKGHWGRECPQSRSNSRPRSQSRGRPTYNSQGNQESLHAKMDKLVDLLSKIVANPTRSPSRERGRSPFRRRAGNQPNSRYGSNSRSRQNSQTRNPNQSRHQSRSPFRQQSRSNSKTRHPKNYQRRG
jgi:hypothetical protein